MRSKATNTARIAALTHLDVDAILCDLDGCLIAGSQVLDGAADFVPANRERLWIVSNNSTDTAATLSARLAGMGLDVDADRIVLAGEQTIRQLAQERRGASVAIYAEARLASIATMLGLRVNAEVPDLVLIARDTRFSLNDLSRVLEYLDRGAELVVTNVDVSHPGPRGAPVAETGAILAALTACRPGTAFTSIGKPDPTLLEIALRSADVERERAVFVGDNCQTDGRAAEAAGLTFIKVSAPAPETRNRRGAVTAGGS